MYTNEQDEHSGRRRRRMHSPELKAELVLQCQQAGVSVAAIAVEHGINPNLLRRWITEYERLGHHEVSPSVSRQRDLAAQFIPLLLTRPQEPELQTQADEQIVIDLQRNGLTASVRWPLAVDQDPGQAQHHGAIDSRSVR